MFEFAFSYLFCLHVHPMFVYPSCDLPSCAKPSVTLKWKQVMGLEVLEICNLQFMQILRFDLKNMIPRPISTSWFTSLKHFRVSPTCCASSFYYFIFVFGRVFFQHVQQFRGCERDRKIKNSSQRIFFSSVAALLRFKHNQWVCLIVFINVLQYCGICGGKKKGKEPDRLQ